MTDREDRPRSTELEELKEENERLLERLEAAEKNYATVYKNAERAEQLWMEVQLERDAARDDNERLRKREADFKEASRRVTESAKQHKARAQLQEENERLRAALKERLEAAEKEKCEHGWRGATPERGDRIRTPCPACGLRALFIGSGGHLTCSSVPSDGAPGCPSPSVQTTWDNQRARIDAALTLLAEAKDTTEQRWRIVKALKGGK